MSEQLELSPARKAWATRRARKEEAVPNAGFLPPGKKPTRSPYLCDECKDSGRVMVQRIEPGHEDADSKGRVISWKRCERCDGKARLGGEVDE